LKCRKKYKSAIYFTYMTRVSIDDITCNILMVSVFQDLWSFIPNYCDYDHSRSLTLDILTVYSYASLPSTYSVLKFKIEMLRRVYWEYMACAKTLYYAAYEMYRIYAINLLAYELMKVAYFNDRWFVNMEGIQCETEREISERWVLISEFTVVKK